MKNIIILLVLGSLVGCGSKNLATGPHGVTGGGADTGGGEYRDMDYGSAWFPGKRIIRYCYVVADNFSVPSGTIEAELDGAFNEWRDYITKKDLRSIPHFGEEFALYVNHAPMHGCDGSEDLKFYFGLSDAQTDEARKHYTNPIAFTHRTSYDPHVGWGKGLIWFAPPGSVAIKIGPSDYPHWAYPNVFRLILVHEIGHTLGVGHIPGTIMDEAIAIWAFDRLDPARTQIDWGVELALCRGDRCSQDYEGRVFEFEKLMGRPPVGKTSAMVHLGSKQAFTFTIADEKSRREFPLATGASTPFSGASTIFQVYRYYVTQEGKEAFGFVGHAHMGEHYFGAMRTATDQLLNLSVQRNSMLKGSPLRIEYVEANEGHVLFETMVPGYQL